MNSNFVLSLQVLSRGNKRIYSYSCANKEQPIYRMLLRSKRLIIISRPTRSISLKHVGRIGSFTRGWLDSRMPRYELKGITSRVGLKKTCDWNIIV